MNEFFFAALSFGLASGIKPGPLGIFVIQQTLSRGLPAGLSASLAPLVTDGPIIVAALALFAGFRQFDLFAAALNLAGGLYLLWLASKMLRTRAISVTDKLASRGSLATAVKVNLLNPGPYLFWFTVGGSYLVRGTAPQGAVFVATSIGALIAAKAAMAVLAARFLPGIESRGYLWVMKMLAATMTGFGLLSLARGVELARAAGGG